MVKYSLLIKPSAIKDIEAIPLKRNRQGVIERISKLAENTRSFGAEKISGQDKYRVRQEHYRIPYSMEDQDLLVHIIKVGHQKDVYQ